MTSFITLTNTGYVEITLNCLESLKRINTSIQLDIYCIGKQGHEILKNNGYKSILIDEEENSNFQLYREGNWSNITFNKFKIIYENLLKYEYVCFTDGDIVYEKKGFYDYLLENIGDNDMLIQNECLSDDVIDNSEEICSGFMFIRSNETTIEFFNPKNMEDKKNLEGWDDQKYINENKESLKYKKLSLELFPNGNYYYKNYLTIEPFLIHFNWLAGTQKKRKNDTI